MLNVLHKPAVKKQRTNEYVVYRLHCALQEPKDDRTEAGRQAYCTILTAMAPGEKAPGDQTGMKKAVAKTIGVSRNGLHYADAIDMCVEIDAAIHANRKPLAVGYTVCCVHGTGELVDMPAGYPKTLSTLACRQAVLSTSLHNSSLLSGTRH